MNATTSNPHLASATGLPSGATSVKALEFLAFTLGQEEYGIDIQLMSSSGMGPIEKMAA
jgi:purine-binding chemotaxis protein CheW